MNAQYAYDRGITGKGVTIAIIDSANLDEQPEFAGRISLDSKTMDFRFARCGDCPAETYDFGKGDTSGHGTAVTAIAAAAKDGNGIHGVAYDATILSIRTVRAKEILESGPLEPGGEINETALPGAIIYAVDKGAFVVSMSLNGRSGNDYSAEYRTAMDHVRANDRLFVQSVSNWNGDDSFAGTETEVMVGSDFANKDWFLFGIRVDENLRAVPTNGNPGALADRTLSVVANNIKSIDTSGNVIPVDGKTKPFWQIPQENMSLDTRSGSGPAWSPDGTRMAGIYEGLLKVWPVAADAKPLGPARSYTSDIAFFPTWSGDGKTILVQSNDALKTVNLETGVVTDVPINLTYRLAKPTGRTIIHVGALVDSVTDATQTNKDIVIDGNRITAIRDHDPARSDATARYVDASTLTAIPGLIEYHSHIQKDFGSNLEKAWLAYGITTVRDPGTQVYDAVEDREAAEAGVRISPRLYTGGPLLEWQRVYYKMGIAVSSPAHLERELALVKVTGQNEKRIEALRVAEIFRVHVVDSTLESFVFEVTGTTGKIDAFIDLMRPLGLKDVSRTGVAAIKRGKMGIGEAA